MKLRSEQKLPPVYNQGIARTTGGWVVSGTDVIGVVDDRGRQRRRLTPAIPADLTARRYDHVGDVDVIGSCIYAPLEQSDYTLGEQVTARYDLKTLRYVDSVTLPQHENSFVTIDPATGVAYTMDNFSGRALLRYDVLHAWSPLAPLALDAYLYKVQGAAVGAGALWLSTSDAGNPMYRVDATTGHVDQIGAAGHTGGEGEGIAFAPTTSGVLHPVTVAPGLTPVFLGNFTVDGVSAKVARTPRAKRALASCR